ncbi:MAG: hypothetical protein HDR29_03070, partial [Lachnospiraceae bacterium]|nr:hypothetical protein [Lachnospiraceae bacterium]
MTNTATSANITPILLKEQKSNSITFKDKEHEKFYYMYLPKCRTQDVYHRALIYCLGINADT